MDKEIYEMGKEIFNYLKDNFKVYTVEECKQLEKEGAYGFVYITQCKVNSKLYIGQKKLSKKDFATYLGSGTLFTKAVKKYGKENFERIILQIAYSQEELDNFEIKYIELFDASKKDNDLFYNIALGGKTGGVCLKGEDNPLYKQRTKVKCDYCGKELERLEWELKNHKNNFCDKKCADEWKKENIKGENNPNYGKHHSEEARNKIGEANRGVNNHNYGKHPSEGTRKKMSEANRGVNNSQAKRIVCIFPDGRVIKDVCIKELAKELGINEDTIRSRLNSHEPYKVSKKAKKSDIERLKKLEGMIIMEEKDYLNIIENKYCKINEAS